VGADVDGRTDSDVTNLVISFRCFTNVLKKDNYYICHITSVCSILFHSRDFVIKGGNFLEYYLINTYVCPVRISVGTAEYPDWRCSLIVKHVNINIGV